MKTFAVVALLLFGCRETTPIITNPERTQYNVVILYYKPNVAIGDTLIWYSPTAFVRNSDGVEVAKIQNGQFWVGKIASQTLIIGVYYRTVFNGREEKEERIEKFLFIDSDKEWKL